MEGSKKGLDMTTETKLYLDEHFRHLEQRILDITNPIKEDISEYRKNFKEIYVRLGSVEGSIKVLEDNKGSRQSNAGTILIVIGLILTAALAAIGWLR